MPESRSAADRAFPETRSESGQPARSSHPAFGKSGEQNAVHCRRSRVGILKSRLTGCFRPVSAGRLLTRYEQLRQKRTGKSAIPRKCVTAAETPALATGCGKSRIRQFCCKQYVIPQECTQAT